ncbi:MAG: acyl-CoA thioesterase [Xanthomonadaceae bacterium]|jgi:acyl-CoA hydrolase|nr:acyl-CoA thioesterase [Xanthomonadaceae bacterium]
MPGTQRELTLRFLAEPADVNYGGKVFGGAVMKWIDQAGYALASAWSGRYAVTVYVGGIQFENPIAIGSLVEVRARLLHTGTTSMHIGVDVHAADPRAADATPRRTTHCIIVFVAVDDARQPATVPVFVPTDDEQRELQAYALRFMDLRRGVEAERRAFLQRFDPAGE